MATSDEDEAVPVLLLKTKSTPHDGYADYFSDPQNGRYQPVFIPVLEHRFREEALQQLRARVSIVEDKHLPTKSGQKLSYAGIVFTSQRAVEAFSKVIAELRHEGTQLSDQLSEAVPFYVVGPATARGLRALDLPCPIVGEETGNGEALAAFIQDDYRSRADERVKRKEARSLPLLFLVGEQRRDIIPKTLSSESLPADQRIAVDELTVYETGEMQPFREDFKRIWSSNAQRNISEQWVVIFSPTGCKAVLETLQLLSPLGDQETSTSRTVQNTHIATIGPTTRDYLLREFGIEPDVCAPKPSPEGVWDAIRSYTEQHARIRGLEHNFATQIT